MSSLKKIKSLEDLELFKEGKFNPEKRTCKYDITLKGGLLCPDRGSATLSGLINGVRPPSILRLGVDRYNQQHPTQKSLELMRLIILMTTCEGDLILDPFAGSATTLAASRELNREGIGIECDPEYFQIAVNRLSQNNPPRGIIPIPSNPDDVEPIPCQLSFHL